MDYRSSSLARFPLGVTDYPRPTPLPLPHPTGRQLRRRALQTFRVTARHFRRLAARRLLHRPVSEHAFARPLRRTFEELGGTFVKFGQLIASAPGIFGDPVSREFRSCLDTGPPVSLAEVRAAIEATLGRPLEDAFASFEETPIGRASIAVVHRVRLHDGRLAAVKVLRPGIELSVATDLRLMEPLLDFLSRQVGVAAAGQLVRALDGFRQQVSEELDLRNEARAMTHYRELLRRVDLPLVVVPEPYPELSGPRVLTMEFLDGVPIDDLPRIAELGIDPRPLIEQSVRGWFLTTIRWGVFHGDVHAGNLLLLRDGRIAAIDWGIMGQLDPDTHRFFRRVLQAALGDQTAWDEVAARLVQVYGPAIRDGLGLDDSELAGFIRGVMEPMLTRPFGEASLATFLAAMQGQVAKAQGQAIHARSWRARLGRLREQRRLHRDVAGAIGSEFDRGTFLLGKQLAYFERYGKMFLSDVSLLADRKFFEALLAET
ncbi:MAG TPA: AarF/UbiB family protein [Candidatus Binatus sp.]|nr:AarF/UbiB family protein [Candidatus Binatus sp.]